VVIALDGELHLGPCNTHPEGLDPDCVAFAPGMVVASYEWRGARRRTQSDRVGASILRTLGPSSLKLSVRQGSSKFRGQAKASTRALIMAWRVSP
jgi:hypothetical protein